MSKQSKQTVITMAMLENAVFADDVIIVKDEVRTTHDDKTRVFSTMRFSLGGMEAIKALETYVGATLVIRRQGGVKQLDNGEQMEKVLRAYENKPVQWEDAGKKPEVDPMDKIRAMLSQLAPEERAEMVALMTQGSENDSDDSK
jgi:hypothetical protein